MAAVRPWGPQTGHTEDYSQCTIDEKLILISIFMRTFKYTCSTKDLFPSVFRSH